MGKTYFVGKGKFGLGVTVGGGVFGTGRREAYYNEAAHQDLAPPEGVKQHRNLPRIRVKFGVSDEDKLLTNAAFNLAAGAKPQYSNVTQLCADVDRQVRDLMSKAPAGKAVVVLVGTGARTPAADAAAAAALAAMKDSPAIQGRTLKLVHQPGTGTAATPIGAAGSSQSSSPLVAAAQRAGATVVDIDSDGGYESAYHTQARNRVGTVDRELAHTNDAMVVAMDRLQLRELHERIKDRASVLIIGELTGLQSNDYAPQDVRKKKSFLAVHPNAMAFRFDAEAAMLPEKLANASLQAKFDVNSTAEGQQCLRHDDDFQSVLSRTTQLRDTLDGAYGNLSKRSTADAIEQKFIAAIKARPESERHVIAREAVRGYAASLPTEKGTKLGDLRRAVSLWKSDPRYQSLCNYLVPALASRALDAKPGDEDFATVDALLDGAGANATHLQRARKQDATSFLNAVAALDPPDLLCALMGAAHAFLPLIQSDRDIADLRRAIKNRAYRLDEDRKQVLLQELTKLGKAPQ